MYKTMHVFFKRTLLHYQLNSQFIATILGGRDVNVCVCVCVENESRTHLFGVFNFPGVWQMCAYLYVPAETGHI